MKKIVWGSVVAGIMSASVAQAETAFLENWESRSYAQAKLGFADVGTSDDAIAFTGIFGLKTPDIHPMFSVEVELMKTLVDGETSITTLYGTSKVEVSAFGLGAYAVASYDQLPVENLVPYVRLGLAYTSAEASSGGYSADGSEFGLGFSIGLRYDINEKIGVLVDYTSTEADILNAGIQYNF